MYRQLLHSSRHLAFAAAVLACGTALAEDPLPEQPVSLKSHVEVQEDTVYLRDLFDGVTRYGDRALARAPKPGQSMTFKATWLWRVSNLYNLGWRPTSRLDISTMTRSATLVDSDQIKDAVRLALFEKTGEDDLIDLSFENSLTSLYISSNRRASVKVKRLNYDRNNGRFTAEVVAPATGKAEASTVIAGRVHAMVEAAVPLRRILPGQIIREKDLEIVRFRRNRVNRNAVLDPGQLIGQSARRTLMIGKAINLNQVEPPRLVKRNGLVTIYLNLPNMQLTAQGKALQNGSDGEVIQVRNVQSNIVIEAVVSGPGKVNVIMPTTLAMQ